MSSRHKVTHSGSAAEGAHVRCLCNKLVCIRFGNVIEIKCSKCKRMINIYTRGIDRVEIE